MQIFDIVCDVCGKSCRVTSGLGNIEYATLSAGWGYDSPYDMEKHELHLCVDCYQKLPEPYRSKIRRSIYTSTETLVGLDSKWAPETAGIQIRRWE